MAEPASSPEPSRPREPSSPSERLPNLELGMVVHIASADNQFKYMTRLLGVDMGRTLITALPSLKQLKRSNVVYDELLAVHKPLVMRLISNGVAYAFQNEVAGLIYKPSKLMFATYPEQVQTRALRNETRYPCGLPGEYQNHEGVVSNISPGGCQLQLPAGANIGVSADAPAQPLTIRFPLSEQASELQARVKSSQQVNQHLTLGLAFEGDTSSVTHYLDSLHLEDMKDLF